MKTTEYTGNLNLNLSGQISYKDYRNTMLELFFKGAVTKIVLFLAIILFISFVMGKNQIGFYLFPLVFFYFFVFFSVIYQAKKIYRENKTFRENLTYHIDNEIITITSETAHSTQKWSRFFEIKETRTSFVLFHDSIVANYLDKKMFSAEEIVEFRKFLNSLDVKKKLKNK